MLNTASDKNSMQARQGAQSRMQEEGTFMAG
jgi:hypothetical protein